MVFTVFIYIIIIVIIVFIIIGLINLFLRKAVDHFLSEKEQENFENQVLNLDDCSKRDRDVNTRLQCQTASNIPLTPIHNDFFVDEIYKSGDLDGYKLNNELKTGRECMNVPKLLYDGIWNSDIKSKNGYENDDWQLTGGGLSNDYYCSDSNNFLQRVKPIPENFKDLSSTPCIQGGEYYTYFNDEVDDKYDYEIKCFENVFNAGI